MSTLLAISEISFRHRHLRKKIKKWVKKGWAKEVNRYRDDECRLYQMHMPHHITEDNKLKVDYDKLARISNYNRQAHEEVLNESKQWPDEYLK